MNDHSFLQHIIHVPILLYNIQTVLYTANTVDGVLWKLNNNGQLSITESNDRCF